MRRILAARAQRGWRGAGRIWPRSRKLSLRVSANSPAVMHARVPVVVVEGTLNALGVVRSLAAGRMPIYLLDTTARCAARWSRHCHYVRVPSISGRALIDALTVLGRSLACRPVLILTGDESVNTVSEFRHELDGLYRFTLPSAEMVGALSDKTHFHALAQREGFAVPRSVCLHGTSDLDMISELVPPLIVKPSDKTLVLHGTVERAVRAASTLEAQRAAARMLSSAQGVIVQQWIDGADSDICFSLFCCDRHGKLAGLFIGRKLLCSPPAIGSTAVCVAAPEVAAELTAATREFIARVGFRGLGSLEFKFDHSIGRFQIIEPTVGRTDWQEEIATLCGINLPLIAYLTALEQPAPPPAAAAPLLAWRQSVGFRTPLAAGVAAVDGFFRWSDPLPGLYYYVFEQIFVRVWRRAYRAASGLSAVARGSA
jgi:D-aspartate ligase